MLAGSIGSISDGSKGISGSLELELEELLLALLDFELDEGSSLDEDEDEDELELRRRLEEETGIWHADKTSIVMLNNTRCLTFCFISSPPFLIFSSILATLWKKKRKREYLFILFLSKRNPTFY